MSKILTMFAKVFSLGSSNYLHGHFIGLGFHPLGPPSLPYASIEKGYYSQIQTFDTSTYNTCKNLLGTLHILRSILAPDKTAFYP